MRYDVVVVGTEPAGLRIAHAAARQRCRVALLSPLMSENADSYTARPTITHDLAEILENRADLLPTVIPARTQFAQFSRHFRDLWRKDWILQVEKLQDLGVRLIAGELSLLEANRIAVTNTNRRVTFIRSDRIVLNLSTRHRATQGIRCNGKTIVSGDQLLSLARIPRRIAVVGAGMLGMAWAELLSRFGSEITVIDGNPSPILGVTDRIAGVWQNRIRERNLRLVSGYDAIGVDTNSSRGLSVILECGLRVPTDLVLAAHGRSLDTDHFALDPFGAIADDRGRLWCDDRSRTAIPSIYAAGQTISYPEQNRYTQPAIDEIFPDLNAITPAPQPRRSRQSKGKLHNRTSTRSRSKSAGAPIATVDSR